MIVEFDTNNYKDNRQPELRMPIMAEHLMKWGWVKNIFEANVFLVIFAMILIGVSGSYFFITQIAYSNSDDLVLRPFVSSLNIKDYISRNISELSPVKSELGGTFYVTKIEVHKVKGIVNYEDGHRAYVADFIYTSDPSTGIDIKSFVIRN